MLANFNKKSKRKNNATELRTTDFKYSFHVIRIYKSSKLVQIWQVVNTKTGEN